MRKRIVVVGVIFIVLCVTCCIVLKWCPIDNYISIIGSFASIFGIWVACLQIRSVREVAEGTRQAVNEKMLALNSHLTQADMSRIFAMGKEVQAYIHTSLIVNKI